MKSGELLILGIVSVLTLGAMVVGVAWAKVWQDVSYQKYATQRAKWEADTERQLGHALWPDDPEGEGDDDA